MATKKVPAVHRFRVWVSRERTEDPGFRESVPAEHLDKLVRLGVVEPPEPTKPPAKKAGTKKTPAPADESAPQRTLIEDA